MHSCMLCIACVYYTTSSEASNEHMRMPFDERQAGKQQATPCRALALAFDKAYLSYHHHHHAHTHTHNSKHTRTHAPMSPPMHLLPFARDS